VKGERHGGRKMIGGKEKGREGGRGREYGRNGRREEGKVCK
jgi:hypothetical protein